MAIENNEIFMNVSQNVSCKSCIWLKKMNIKRLLM